VKNRGEVIFIMNRSESISYATLALGKLGYPKSEIEKITNKMLEEMETYSVAQAERAADEIVYDD
jgi:Holliday junction resolvasome RuvABC DNA-binding subunit